MEIKDDARVVQYGERILSETPDDVLLLDRVSQALLALGGKENAAKALKYALVFEGIINGLEPAQGRDAAQRQEDRDRAMGRTRLTESRANAVLGNGEEALRAANASFLVYPSEESAREWADCLLRLGREKEALARLADAFQVFDPRAPEQARRQDRARLGTIYAKLNDSEKGLGDLILEAYDRTSALIDQRRQKLLALDPNGLVQNPLDYTISDLDGKSFPLSSLKGKVVVLDFWATWCGPCRVQHPMFEDLKKHYSSRSDVVFLNLSADEDRTLVAPFVEAQQWPKPVYFEDGLARLLQVTSIPTTVLYDKRGRVASRMNGFLPEGFVEAMMERIDAALADQ